MSMGKEYVQKFMNEIATVGKCNRKAVDTNTLDYGRPHIRHGGVKIYVPTDLPRNASELRPYVDKSQNDLVSDQELSELVSWFGQSSTRQPELSNLELAWSAWHLERSELKKMKKTRSCFGCRAWNKQESFCKLGFRTSAEEIYDALGSYSHSVGIAEEMCPRPLIIGEYEVLQRDYDRAKVLQRRIDAAFDALGVVWMENCHTTCDTCDNSLCRFKKVYRALIGDEANDQC